MATESRVNRTLAALIVCLWTFSAGCYALAFWKLRSDDLERWAPTKDFVARPFGLSSYNGMTRTGRWTLERIDGSVKSGDRSGIGFHADPDVPEEFAPTVGSYAGSGMDIGHLAPSADHGTSIEEQRSTFAITNACPEFPKMNRGTMARAEAWCRSKAKEMGVRHVLIVTAPCWLPQYRKDYRFEAIGDARIWVPTHVCKSALIVYADGRLACKSWCIANVDEDQTLEDCDASVDEIEGKIGLDLWQPLPDEQEKELERIKG